MSEVAWDRWANHTVEPPHWTDWQQPHWTDRFRSSDAPQWLVDLLTLVVPLTVFFSILVALLANG